MEPEQAWEVLTYALQYDPGNALLGEALTVAASRLDPGKAASRLVLALKGDPAIATLAEILARTAVRLEPPQAASVLTEVMSRSKGPHALHNLARSLGAVAAHLPEPQCRRAANEAGVILLQTMRRTGDPETLRVLARGWAALAAYMDPAQTMPWRNEIVEILFKAMASTSQPNNRRLLAEGLAVVIHRYNPPGAGRCGALVFASVGQIAASGNPVVGVPGLLLAGAPAPHPLGPQELVDLLKLPTCIGPARRVILDQLENHYQRSFADTWDFVRFAQHQRLDVSSPPQRWSVRAPGSGP
jgi:hypothetical protein